MVSLGQFWPMHMQTNKKEHASSLIGENFDLNPKYGRQNIWVIFSQEGEKVSPLTTPVSQLGIKEIWLAI